MEKNGKPESIFRKKSFDTINSPEALNDYVRVASPGVWIVLITIIVFLAGVFVWGIYGHLDTTETAPLMVVDGVSMLCIDEDHFDTFTPGMPVYVDDQAGTIGEFSSEPVPAESIFSSYNMHVFDLWEDSWIYTAPVPELKLKNGIHIASVLVESASPFTLIFK